MRIAYKINIQGRVQGVGFRWFTMQIAQQMNLSGYVMNLRNGDVEVFIQGDETIVQEFMDRLKQGPSFSQITNLTINDADIDNNFKYFKVKH